MRTSRRRPAADHLVELPQTDGGVVQLSGGLWAQRPLPANTLLAARSSSYGQGLGWCLCTSSIARSASSCRGRACTACIRSCICSGELAPRTTLETESCCKSHLTLRLVSVQPCCAAIALYAAMAAAALSLAAYLQTTCVSRATP